MEMNSVSGITRAASQALKELRAGGDLRREIKTGHYILGLASGPKWERRIRPATVAQLKLVRCERHGTYAANPCDWYELAEAAK
jgi:hypothetical protein